MWYITSMLLLAAVTIEGMRAQSHSKSVTPRTDLNMPPVSINALPDGIAITAGEPLRQAVATWNVYVTLEKPQPCTALFKKSYRFRCHAA